MSLHATAAAPLAEPIDRPFRLEGWRIDPQANEITNGEKTIRLEPKAMLLLACLACRAERPVTREALTSAIWPDVVVGEDSLSRLVFQLRRAFGDDPRRPRFIETLPKVGYRLAAVAQPAGPVHPAPPRPRATGASRSVSLLVSERAPGSAVLLAVAVLGCAFSSGWWSGRAIARRHRAHGHRSVPDG